jgi:hypothetical protein
MGQGPDYDHHIERARAEMDCAYRAVGYAAAAAHMKLSALHMHRARLAKEAARPATAAGACGADICGAA